jgi:hypothetical protein
VSDEQSGAAPYRVTFKGQSQTDPWLTVEGSSLFDFRDKLSDLDANQDVLTLLAKVAAGHVTALNAQEGISEQRDRKASQPAVTEAAPASASPSANRPRPSLSSSLEPESDGCWYINIPWDKNAGRRDRMKAKATQLQARYKPEEAEAAGVPLNSKGKPERPWCVHPKFVSEEQAAELLHLHETGFAEVK